MGIEWNEWENEVQLKERTMYNEAAGWTCARLHPDLQVATVTIRLMDPLPPTPVPFPQPTERT